MTTTVPAPPAARSADVRTGTRPRVALYSHDAQGLGHVRRNLAIAHALSGMEPAPDILLLTGAPEAVAAHRPRGCDLVSLPGLAKDADGDYGARHLSVGQRHVVDMRRAVLTAALTSFRPDVLVVDKHPRGLRGELEPALRALAGTTQVVLGLRDVLDDPAVARREWSAERNGAALDRWYDAVWVYGDAAVHDPLAGLELPRRLRHRTVHTGYLAHGRDALPSGRRTAVESPYVLATVGGGSDGATLAEAFARAAMPAGHRGVLVTGPQMPPRERRRIHGIAENRPELEVHEFVEDATALLAGASAVVGMGGYNTVCEAMSAGTPMLVVPRVRPRTEQLVRARALTAAGVIDHLTPDRLSAAALTDWLAGAVRRAPVAGHGVDLDGLRRLPALFSELAHEKENADVA